MHWLKNFRHRSNHQLLSQGKSVLDRYYAVPYQKELSNNDLATIRLLERMGIVEPDEGMAGLHWHLSPQGREWYDDASS